MRAVRAAGVFAASVAVAVVAAACGSSNYTSVTKGTAAPPTTAAPAAAVQGTSNPKYGQILVDAQGMTLYLNTREKTGATYTIACTGSCTTAWPPLTVAAGTMPEAGAGATGSVGTMTRPEGTTQVTYGGAPLYRFAADHAPGDTNGQGVGGIWFVVPVSGPAAAGAAPAGATATTAAPVAPATKSTTATTPATMRHSTTTPMRTATTSCAYPPCM